MNGLTTGNGGVYELLPYERVGPVVFGMSLDLLRKNLAVSTSTARGAPDVAFPSLGLTAYAADGRSVSQVAFTGEGRDHVLPSYQGYVIRPEQPLGTLQQALGRWDDPEVAEVGVLFEKLGLGLFVTGDPEDESTPVSGVIVFGPGSFPGGGPGT